MFFVYKGLSVVSVFRVVMRERRGACRLHDGDLRLAIDQSSLQQLAKAFAERGAVAKVSTRQDELIWHLPLELLGKFERDCLLSFNAKWIDRVDEVNPVALREFANERH